jgi:hypothetical protein
MPLAELFGLVALRLAYPDVVEDLNRAAGLHGVRDEGDHLVIAAKLTDQFAACLADRVRGPAPVPDGATPAQAPAATTTPEPENTAAPQTAAAESLDLVSAVAMPVLKRLGPVLGGLAFGLVLGLLLGHRRRIVIMTAAAPGSYRPARTVL